MKNRHRVRKNLVRLKYEPINYKHLPPRERVQVHAFKKFFKENYDENLSDNYLALAKAIVYSCDDTFGRASDEMVDEYIDKYLPRAGRGTCLRDKK
jgi:hypothetical protein